MSNLTYAHQIRVAVVTNRVAKFKLTMKIVDRGDLPDDAVFLKEIIDPNDPKEDTLVRVTGVGDLLTYSSDRPTAMSDGEPYWRDKSAVKFYDDIEKARSASLFLKERLNDLVKTYSTYITDFEADPFELISFPEADLGLIGPLIDDYAEKVEERKEHQKLVQEKQDECDDLDDQYADAVIAVQDARATLDSLNTAKSSLTDVRSALNTQYVASESLRGDIIQALTDWDSVRGTASQNVQDVMDDTLEDGVGELYSQYHNDFKDKITVLNQKIAELDSKIAELTTKIAEQQNRLTTTQTEKSQLLLAKETCAKDLVKTQAALDEIERVEADLLQEARDLCPTFEGE